MKRKLLPIAFASLLLGLVFDFLFYDTLPGISFFLFCALILVTTFYLAGYYRHELGKSVLLLAPLILIFSGAVFIRASGLLIFLNIVFTLYLLALFVQLSSWPRSKLQNYTVTQYINRLFALPIWCPSGLFAFLRHAIDSRSETGPRKQQITPVVRGIVLALPFLFIFLLLLSSADLVFKNYVDKVFNFNVSPDLISHILLILFATSAFIGTYMVIFNRSNQDDLTAAREKRINLGTIEASIVLGSVACLFLVFVLIQVTYLFGGESNVVGSGFTYAQYARKGFFELIAVAVISFALIMVLHASTLRQTLKQRVVFMWLSGALILEVLVIMLSAHKRLGLYEQTYGFTELRLFSHIFIGWLAVVFALLLVHIVRRQRENQFALQLFMSVIAFMLLLNVINPDALIAKKNIERFKRTGKIDLSYLEHLSADALPQIVRLLDDPNQQVQKATASFLYDKQVHEGEPWQSYNVSRSRAQAILEAHQPKLYQNRDYTIPRSENFRD